MIAVIILFSGSSGNSPLSLLGSNTAVISNLTGTLPMVTTVV